MRGGYIKKGGKIVKKKELIAIFEKIPKERQNEAKLIIEELSYILPTLKKLKSKVKKDGPIENFEQGSQKFTRESPALKSYNQLMKTYDTFLKNLISLIPPENNLQKNPEDEFDEFNK